MWWSKDYVTRGNIFCDMVNVRDNWYNFRWCYKRQRCREEKVGGRGEGVQTEEKRKGEENYSDRKRRTWQKRRWGCFKYKG